AVLFADYLAFYFPGLVGWKHWLVSLALIAFITWINIRGIQMVGKTSTAFELFVFVPVIGLVVLGLAKWHHNPFVPFTPPNQPFATVFGVGLALGVWLYSGYEQLSTVAEEVENPQRTYPRALALVVPLPIPPHFLPTFPAPPAPPHPHDWHHGYFAVAAQPTPAPSLATSTTTAP